MYYYLIRISEEINQFVATLPARPWCSGWVRATALFEYNTLYYTFCDFCPRRAFRSSGAASAITYRLPDPRDDGPWLKLSDMICAKSWFLRDDHLKFTWYFFCTAFKLCGTINVENTRLQMRATSSLVASNMTIEISRFPLCLGLALAQTEVSVYPYTVNIASRKPSAKPASLYECITASGRSHQCTRNSVNTRKKNKFYRKKIEIGHMPYSKLARV